MPETRTSLIYDETYCYSGNATCSCSMCHLYSVSGLSGIIRNVTIEGSAGTCELENTHDTCVVGVPRQNGFAPLHRVLPERLDYNPTQSLTILECRINKTTHRPSPQRSNHIRNQLTHLKTPNRIFLPLRVLSIPSPPTGDEIPT